MHLPFVLEQCGIRINVGVLRGTGRARRFAAIFRVGTGVVLWPQSMQGESAVLGALGRFWMPVAELWGPGKVEQVEVELARRRGECPTTVVATRVPRRRAVAVSPLVPVRQVGPSVATAGRVIRRFRAVVVGPVIVPRLVASAVMVAMMRFGLVAAVIFVFVSRTSGVAVSPRGLGIRDRLTADGDRRDAEE